MDSNGKTLPKTKFVFWTCAILGTAIFLSLAILPNFVVLRPVPSHANTCINNLRNIDLAKNIWALENNKVTNDLPTWDEIKRYLDHTKPYYKFDSKNNLPICPTGGAYVVGKIGDMPTCSLGDTVTPAHVLP